MSFKLATIPEKPSFVIKTRGISNSDENYSSPLVNFVERNRINGIDYTKFYTNVDTNIKVNDRVYIVNGNYDNYDILTENIYKKGVNGYLVLESDKTSITLDIEYSGKLPWLEDSFDNYIKIYSCETLEKSLYEVSQNNFYPYKYMYGYRANNNILFCKPLNKFIVADPYLDNTDINNWVDITSGLMSNQFPIISSLQFTQNNGKLLIMNTFTYNNITYDKGSIYKYTNNGWVKDKLSKKSFISKSNFRSGRFKGNFNDGIFGTIDNKIEWDNAVWKNGILYNAVWKSGRMESKSDNISRQSYYSQKENNTIKSSTDFTNNSGFGYNFIEDSIILSGTIDNSNSNNISIDGYSQSESYLYKYISSTQSDSKNFLNLTIRNGNYISSNIEGSLIIDGLFENSLVKNSESLNGRFLDTSIEKSVIVGDYESIGNINIIGYEKILTTTNYINDNPYVGLTYSNKTDKLIINHKFYISEKNFLKIKSGSFISLNKLVTTNPDILNFFDNQFYLGTDKNGDLYASDNYGAKSKVSVQLKSKNQNSFIRTISSNNFPNFIEKLNRDPLPSIDLFVEISSTVTSISNRFNDGYILSDDYGWSIYSDPTYSTIISTHSNISLPTGLTQNFSSPDNSVKFQSNGLTAISYIESPYIYNAESISYLVTTKDIIGSSNYINLMGLIGNTWSHIDTLTFSGSYSNDIIWTDVSHNISGSYSKYRLDINIYNPILSATMPTIAIDDIEFIGDNIEVFGNNALYSYRDTSNTTTDINYLMDITDVSEAKLQISNISKSIFNGGSWKSTKVNNIDYKIKRKPRIISGTVGDLGEYLDMSFDGSGYLDINLDYFSNIFYNNQFEIGDIVFLDNISYNISPSLTASSIDGSYILATYSLSPLTLKLGDIGTSSFLGSFATGGDFFSSFIVDIDKTFDITDIQENFTSIHFEKIQNTNINNGFLKRTLINNSNFSNSDFITQPDIDTRNVNLLKISEVSIDNSNNLNIDSGLFIKTFIKDTIWNNGIILESVLKDLTLNGVVKNSKWISGTFSDGYFYSNNKSIISNLNDSSLYPFTTESIISGWENGEFLSGEFFDSIWDTGNFRNGKFYNSIFASGNFYNGEFGDIRYSNTDSQFGNPVYTHNSVNNLSYIEPKWHNGIFTNGQFGLRNSENNLPFPTIGTISWLNGTFNDGVIHSYTQSSMIVWEDGVFNNGDIIGYVKWKNGKFNQGKFRSAYGSGLGTHSNNYAWENGIFNNGKFGNSDGLISVRLDNKTVTYQNPSWFNGRFNNGFFYGKYWNNGILTGGRFIGNSISNYYKFFYERFSKSFPTRPVTGPFSPNVNYNIEGDLGTWTITIPNGSIVNIPGISKFRIQIEQVGSFKDSSLPFCLNFTKNITTKNYSPTIVNTSFSDILTSPNITDELSSIELSYRCSFLGNDNGSANPGFLVYTIYLTVTGIDENNVAYNINLSETVSSNFDSIEKDIIKFNPPLPYTSFPSNSKYKFKVEVNGIFGDPFGSPVINVDVNEVDFSINDIRFNTIDNTRTAMIPDHFVMDYSEDSNINYFGMWRNGKVFSDNTVEVGESNFLELSKLESVRVFKGETIPKIFFENALWVDGIFEAFGQMDNCVWLSGTFKNGRFINSNFNPYVPRWDFYNLGGTTASYGLTDSSTGRYQYDLTDNCIWKSGYLDKSKFNISVWESGTFNSGDMYGGLFKQGIANYINAYNSIWENGRFRNGNWYGADFNINEIFKDINSLFGQLRQDPGTFVPKIGKAMDSIILNSKRMGNTYSEVNNIFAWNIFDGSPRTYTQNLKYFYSPDNGNTSNTDYLNNNDYLIMSTMSEINKFGIENESYYFSDAQNLTNVVYDFVAPNITYGVPFNESIIVYGASNSLYNGKQVVKGLLSGFPNLVITNKLYVGSSDGYAMENYNKLMRNRTYGLEFENISYGYDATDILIDFPFTIKSATASDNSLIENKFGNGVFKKGRWENGTWNSGTRLNQSFGTDNINVIMENITNFFQISPDKWQVELTGIEDISILELGDYVSIGNIVGLTVNNERKFLKDSYQIISIDKNNFKFSVIIRTTFPLKSIERDSDNHKIYVSLNIWENGTFHNGRFDGVWLNGTFKGYPMISQMENSQWVDGIFDGGKFISTTNSDIYGNDYNTGLIQNAVINCRNTFDDDIYETWMDVNYDNPYKSSVWNGNLSFYQETTNDILTSVSKIHIGDNSSVQSNLLYGNRKYIQLNLGTKINLYDELIQDDLSGFTAGGRLEDRGWEFKYQHNFFPYSYSPLTSTQSKFIQSNDLMTIDTSGSPTTPPFISSAKYTIGNSKLDNYTKNRYWELSYEIVNRVDGAGKSGVNSYINPYPDLSGLSGSFYTGNIIKAYSYNKKPGTPLISLGGTVVADIDNITFTEVDYIPFYNYWGNPFAIDTDIKYPNQSISPEIPQSESDSKFIDKRQGN